jgi:hypothetical protein
MTSSPCRRDLLLLAAAGVAAVPALALTSTPTLADQGNLERALSALGEAMEALRAASPPNIEAAVHFIQIAMGEVETYASQHGGGGD